MTVLYDGVVAFLAAVGLTALLWLLTDMLLRRKEPSVHAAVLVPVRGSGEQMDYAVMAACSTRAKLGRYAPVIIVDCGLDEEARLRAGLLAKNNNCVTVLLPSEIESYIT